VHGFGVGTARTFGAITERIPGARATTGRGVRVEVGEKEAAIEGRLDLSGLRQRSAGSRDPR
jgi:hypothetical protein